jgi:hypothetical protein
MRAISVVPATTAALCPWGSVVVVTGFVVIASTMLLSSTLLPWSDVRNWSGRSTLLPRFVVGALVVAFRASFDTARSFAVGARATARKFLHELLLLLVV